MPHSTPTRSKLLAVVKVALALGILCFLLYRIQGAAGFERLLREPKHWGSLWAAQFCVICAFSLSFARWFLLVRGLDLKFCLSDAFRLGSLGFMLNQVSPGSVGGDLMKAVFIAREQPGRRPEAVATVLVDRVIGLYAMLLIASVGLVFAGQLLESERSVMTLRLIVWGTAGAATILLALVLSPLTTGPAARRLAASVPVLGDLICRMIDAAEVYRSRRRYLFAAFGLALMTHSLLITAFWCISQGLPVEGPSFAQNASIVPIALVAGALPFTPGGLGALEGSMELLYMSVGAGKGDGTIVALAYRAMTYVFAAAGAFYYISARKNVEELLQEAEEIEAHSLGGEP